MKWVSLEVRTYKAVADCLRSPNFRSAIGTPPALSCDAGRCNNMQCIIPRDETEMAEISKWPQRGNRFVQNPTAASLGSFGLVWETQILLRRGVTMPCYAIPCHAYLMPTMPCYVMPFDTPLTYLQKTCCCLLLFVFV